MSPYIRGVPAVVAAVLALVVQTEAFGQTPISSVWARKSLPVANVDSMTRDPRMLRGSPAFTMQAELADTVTRTATAKVAEGAIIGLTVGALAGGVLTIVADESGNLGWNIFLLGIPGAVLGGILGLIL